MVVSSVCATTCQKTNRTKTSKTNDLSETNVPSQSNRANTTSHTWSDSSTLATVRATCFMVTVGEDGKNTLVKTRHPAERTKRGAGRRDLPHTLEHVWEHHVRAKRFEDQFWSDEHGGGEQRGGGGGGGRWGEGTVWGKGRQIWLFCHWQAKTLNVMSLCVSVGNYILACCISLLMWKMLKKTNSATGGSVPKWINSQPARCTGSTRVWITPAAQANA